MVERELLTPEILRDRLGRDDVKGKIKQAISIFTENILENTPKGLSSGSGNIILEKTPYALEKVYPVLTSAVMEFVNRQDIRRDIESKGRIILQNIMSQLNTLQRFILTAGQYDQTLQEKMPKIIDDLVLTLDKSLKEDKVKQSIINAAVGSIGRMINEDSKKISALLNISAEEKIKLDDFIADKLTGAVDGKIEYILSSINIKSLVSDRIDSLDMIRVERIILDVMSNQLKYVELFGGVLGFFLGLFQAGLSYFLH